jgi:hypothetical protein
MRRFGTKSGAAVPFLIDGTLRAILGFGAMRRRDWGPQVIDRLQLVTAVFGQALMCKESEQHLHAALNEVPGSVLIVGHSDSQPIRSFRYQNNFELSSDRALSVLRRLEATVTVPARLQSNGVGSTQPRYVPDDTAENRAKNRRVEIVHVFSACPTRATSSS